MVDTPPTPTTIDPTQSVNSAEQISEGWQKVALSAIGMDNATSSAAVTLKQLNEVMGKGNLTTDTAASVMAGLTTVVFGARDSFKDLGGSIDSVNLNTLTSQFENFNKSLSGGLLKPVIESIKKISGALPVEEFLKSADNALRARNAFIQLGAQSGTLSTIYRAAGDDLQNINELVAQQGMAIQAAAEGAMIPVATMEKHYAALGSIPGALQSTVLAGSKMVGESAESSSSSVGMLTAATLLAAGSGREFVKIAEDMRKAFQEYGLTGQTAARFTAEIGTVANNTGTDLESMRNALLANANAFKVFADTGKGASNMTSGLANIMNQYVQVLKGSGTSGDVAIGIMANMTTQMSNLTVAQKAFLSAQSGGPGGAQGAFSIDKMLSEEGGTKKLFEMYQKQLKQQFGTFATLADATTQEGSNRLLMQAQTLMQGPMGQMAKTMPEAEKMLKMFKDMDEGRGIGKEGKQVTEIGKNVVAETLDKGFVIQSQSYTVMQQSENHLARIARAQDTLNLNLLQKFGITAGSGAFTQNERDVDSTGARERRASLRGGVQAGMAQSADFNARLAEEMETGKTDKGSTAAKVMGGEAASLRDVVGKYAPSAQSYSVTQVKEAEAQLNNLQIKYQEQKGRHEEASALETLALVGRKEKELKGLRDQISVGLGLEQIAPGAAVGQAATTVSRSPAVAAGVQPRYATIPTGNSESSTKGTTTEQQSKELTISVYCAKCHDQMNPHTMANNAGTDRAR